MVTRHNHRVSALAAVYPLSVSDQFPAAAAQYFVSNTETDLSLLSSRQLRGWPWASASQHSRVYKCCILKIIDVAIFLHFFSDGELKLKF